MNSNNSWHVLTVFLLTGKAADSIIAELVKAGYGIKSAAPTKLLWGEKTAAPFLYIMVQPPTNLTLSQTRDELLPIINKSKHFGFTVSPHSAVSASNITLNALPPKHKPGTRPIHMKLLPPGPMATFIETIEAGKNEEDDTND
jgi:hypothetical protein